MHINPLLLSENNGSVDEVYRDPSSERAAGQFQCWLYFFFMEWHQRSIQAGINFLGDVILAVATRIATAVYYFFAPFTIRWVIVKSSIPVGPSQWY